MILVVQSVVIPYIHTNKNCNVQHSINRGIIRQLLYALTTILSARILYAPVSIDTQDNFKPWLG